jgi:hypothetical protein
MTPETPVSTVGLAWPSVVMGDQMLCFKEQENRMHEAAGAFLTTKNSLLHGSTAF